MNKYIQQECVNNNNTDERLVERKTRQWLRFIVVSVES